MSKVLVIDDDQIIQDRLSKLIRLSGHEVMSTSNGKDGIEIFNKEKPDVVVLDIKMPGMDGTEVLKVMKSDPFGKSYTEIIMVTGHAGVETAIEAMKIGAFAYIQKPVEFDELEISILNAIEKLNTQKKLDDYVKKLEIAFNEVDRKAEEWEATFNSINDMVSVQDSDFKYLMVNTAFANAFKLKPEDFIGKKCYEVVHNSKSPHPQCPVKQMFDVNEPKTSEYFDEHLGIYLEITVSPIINKFSNKMTYVHVAKDITARMNNEKTLKDAVEKSDIANKAKSIFFNNMTHEFRTPMNAIIGFSTLLQKTTLNDDQKDYAQSIKNNAESLIAILNDILDMSKIEAKEIEIDRKFIDLDCLMGSLINTLRHKVKTDEVELIYEYGKDMPTDFYGSPARIRQVLINIIDNAIKFTKKGSIVISTFVDENKDDTAITENVYISVKDTGIGVADDKKEMIFDAFTQANPSAIREYGGVGLGLYISKRILNILGGEVMVKSDSQIGGSEFIITLPLERGAAAIKEDIVVDSNDILKGVDVLIVDDNESSRMILDKYCSSAGMNVIFSAHSGAAALEHLNNTDKLPQIVLSDILMPGMDGIDFIAELRSNEKFSKFIVVAVTIISDFATVNKDMTNGFDAYIQKPISEDSVLSSLRALISDRTKMHEKEIIRESPEEQILNGLRILVVDDQQPNLMVINEFLSIFGCSCDLTTSAVEALVLLKNNKYDILLLDLMMPEISGFELAKTIRDKISIDVPIMAITASVLNEHKEKALSCGMNEIMTKPVDEDELKEKIAKLTGRS